MDKGGFPQISFFSESTPASINNLATFISPSSIKLITKCFTIECVSILEFIKNLIISSILIISFFSKVLLFVKSTKDFK